MNYLIYTLSIIVNLIGENIEIWRLSLSIWTNFLSMILIQRFFDVHRLKARFCGFKLIFTLRRRGIDSSSLNYPPMQKPRKIYFDGFLVFYDNVERKLAKRKQSRALIYLPSADNKLLVSPQPCTQSKKYWVNRNDSIIILILTTIMY